MEQVAAKNYIIDFDSTFTQVEALDILGEIALNDHPERQARLDEIKSITDEGMSGNLTFRESLVKRIAILDAHKK
ncbi:MAG: phosphoglycerate dehydrogenase, partial [Bacteroidota bacterium]